MKNQIQDQGPLEPGDLHRMLAEQYLSWWSDVGWDRSLGNRLHFFFSDCTNAAVSESQQSYINLGAINSKVWVSKQLMGLNGVKLSLLRWMSNQGNSLVFCPCWPLNSLWLQMNWKHNTVAFVWHFPLLGSVNPYLCQRRPARQRITTATSIPASALHAWNYLLVLALSINKLLVDESEQLKWSAASRHAPSPPNLCLHQRDHLFQPFFCSIGQEAGRTPLLLLHWGGIIGGDKHHYNVPQWVLHLNLHVVAWGWWWWFGGWGAIRLYVPTCVFMLDIWLSTPVNHAPKSLLLSPSPSRASSINREDFGEGRLTMCISILLSPSLFSFEQNDSSGWLSESCGSGECRSLLVLGVAAF